MEEKDRPLISWKAISIILIILILSYAGYKGFTYGQTALENYIDVEANARAEEQLKGMKQELYQKTAYIDWAAKSGYMAGYYANKMGYDCPVSGIYFCSVYDTIKDYLPGDNLDAIAEKIISEKVTTQESVYNQLQESIKEHNTPELNGTNGWKDYYTAITGQPAPSEQAHP